MTLTWQGQTYAVPEREPPQDRDPASLYPPFRGLLETYVAFAQGCTLHEVRLGECRRTEARQAWLYAQGRVNAARVRSWTMESRHRWGLACDLILIDRATGRPVWDERVWLELYAAAPPAWFGLTTISRELVHLEHAAADALIARAEALGLYQT